MHPQPYLFRQAPQSDEVEDMEAFPPEDEGERLDWLFRNLGEAMCRRLGIYRVPEHLTLSVVIPVYDEKNSIHEILRQVRDVPIRKQIILVDDCSKDGTREILQKMVETDPDLTIVFHDVNQGKGAALRTGFKHATGDIVIVQDADLEYDPTQYPQLLQPIIEGKAASSTSGTRRPTGA
jgi:cellulose synthase/poly-beta-1,6-N-acetylglucosamine synthase-like glycosyltransferase